MWMNEVYLDGDRHVTQQKTTGNHETAGYGRETSELKIMVPAVRFCPSAPLLSFISAGYRRHDTTSCGLLAGVVPTGSVGRYRLPAPSWSNDTRGGRLEHIIDFRTILTDVWRWWPSQPRVEDSNPDWRDTHLGSIPETWVTDHSEDIGHTFSYHE
jgi:hypothetical protein